MSKKLTKAILTGGGHATRLRPITTTINKHLIPLANKPMIFHAIEKAVEAGIKDIFININPEETELQKVVGDGGRWGIKVQFFVQEGGPQGIAHVVKCAEKFIGSDPFMFYLSDNIILGSLKPFFETFEAGQYDAALAFSKVTDPQRFGVPYFDEKGNLINIVEKPINPPNNFAVTGIYIYGQEVFFKAFDHIKKSSRGEYEISDINSYLLKHSHKIGWQEITGWWKDTGKPNDLILANNLLLDELPINQFICQGEKEVGAKLNGKVEVGEGTTIDSRAEIIGPVIIGKNCKISNCHIGPYVTIGDNSVIENVTITESIIFDGCNITAPISVTQSILGDSAAIIKRVEDKRHRLILGDHTLMEV